MRITEFINPEPTSFISPEDEARIADTVQQGESAWSKPMTLEEAIAATLKSARSA
jgi:hypothetical protein